MRRQKDSYYIDKEIEASETIIKVTTANIQTCQDIIKVCQESKELSNKILHLKRQMIKILEQMIANFDAIVDYYCRKKYSFPMFTKCFNGFNKFKSYSMPFFRSF